jgi:purine-binding chemotaxis protein CheW
MTADNYILFTVADTAYGLPSQDVAHVEMVEQITKVPNAPSFVDGVVFSRGQVVPAINMRARFGFERAPITVSTRLLVVQSRGRSVGLLVDACREFLTVPQSAIHPPGDALSGLGAQYVDGVATINDRLIVLLGLERLLGTTEHAVVPA